MAQGVVDRLEVVQIQKEERAGLLVAPRMRHRLARPLREHGAVGKSRQRVVVREEFQPPRVVLQLDRGVAQVFLRALELRHVVRQDVEAQHLALGPEVRHAGDLQDAPLRAVAHRELELHARATEHALDVRTHAPVGFVAEHLGDGTAVHAFVRDAEPVVVGAVGEAVALVAIDVGNERRHVVGDEPQPLLALAQGGFRLLGALCRTAIHDHRRGEQERRAGDQDVQHQLARPGAVAREPGADRRDDLRPGAEDQDGRTEGDEQRRKRPHEVLHRPAMIAPAFCVGNGFVFIPVCYACRRNQYKRVAVRLRAIIRSPKTSLMRQK